MMFSCCLEKFAIIDVFEVASLSATKQRLFSCNIQTILFLVLPICQLISEHFGKLHDSMTHNCKIMTHYSKYNYKRVNQNAVQKATNALIP